MRRAEARTRTIPSLALATTLLLSGCGSGVESPTPGDPASTAVATTPQLSTTTEAPETTDAANAETLAIIQAWIAGWLADDPNAVIALYADDGIYADAAYPFEYPVDYLVRNHMATTTYTVVDPLEITYTESGAIVDWVWDGRADGEEFSMNATTIFEIENGKIQRSTDSYERCVAPWTEDCES